MKIDVYNVTRSLHHVLEMRIIIYFTGKKFYSSSLRCLHKSAKDNEVVTVTYTTYC